MQMNGSPSVSASFSFSWASSVFLATDPISSSSATSTTGILTWRANWVTHTGTTRSGQRIRMRRAPRARTRMQNTRLLPVPIDMARRMPRRPAAKRSRQNLNAANWCRHGLVSKPSGSGTVISASGAGAGGSGGRNTGPAAGFGADGRAATCRPARRASNSADPRMPGMALRRARAWVRPTG